MLSLHEEDTPPLSEGNAILGTETERIQPVAVPGLEGTEKLPWPASPGASLHPWARGST